MIAGLAVAAPTSALGLPERTDQTRTEQADPGSAVTFDVFSDIQGSLLEFDEALRDAHALAPDSQALVINGDIVNRGFDEEYQDVGDVLDRNAHPDPVLSTIGNHEFYAAKYCDRRTMCEGSFPNGMTEQQLYDSFYSFAGRDRVYDEHLIGDIPLLLLGQETYGRFHVPHLRDDTYLSPEQLAWLRERLEHHTRSGGPAFVFIHHPILQTVTGTYGTGTNQLKLHHQEAELLDILGDFPEVVLMTSHTHADLNSEDWAVRKVVPGGHPDGFTVINTGAIQNSQALQVRVEQQQTVIRARDFADDRWIQELVLPRPDPRDPGSGLRLSTPSENVVPGDVVPVTVEFTNHGRRPQSRLGLSLEVPTGWTATRTGDSWWSTRVAPGESVQATWDVQPPSDASPGERMLTAAAEGAHDRRTVTSPLDVVARPEGEVSVSDLPFLSSSNGLGPVERDLSNRWLQAEDGFPIKLGGTRYAKGLGTMAPSSVEVYLGGACSRFTAAVGIDDAIMTRFSGRFGDKDREGDAVFRVLADGEVVYTSDVVRTGDPARTIDISVADVERLELVVDPWDDDNYWDEASWGAPLLNCR